MLSVGVCSACAGFDRAISRFCVVDCYYGSALRDLGNRKKRQYSKAEFANDAAADVYRCPAGEELTYLNSRDEDGLKMRRCWTSACRDCLLR